MRLKTKGMRNDLRRSDTVHTRHMSNTNISGPVGVASASATPEQGTVKFKKFNCTFHQIEMIADPNVVADLLYIPKPEDSYVNVAYTYVGGKRRVRFENRFDGKTIGWYVDGVEMPEFCECDKHFVGQALLEVCQSAQE